MDSLQLILDSAGQKGVMLRALLPLAGMLITVILELIKKTVIAKYIGKADHLAGGLSVLAVIGLAYGLGLAPDLDWEGVTYLAGTTGFVSLYTANRYKTVTKGSK